VFAELGYAGATTNKIAAHAGVSIGSLYQYFPNKESLVAALLASHRKEVRAVLEEVMAELGDTAVPLDVALHSLFDRLVDLHSKSPALHRLLGDAARHEHSRNEEERYVRELEQILRARPEITVADPALAALLTTRVLESLIRWLGHEAPKKFNRTAFITECVSMLCAYLT
jgi:AcrR family transcriptional regulator